MASKRKRILPGFGLTMGYTVTYLSLVVIIPLAGLFWKSATLTWPELWKSLTDPFLISSLKVTFGLSLVAAILNVIFGFITAWTLVRHRFWGHRIVDGLIDLPFALPTAVSGITLATLYANNGWLGQLWTPVHPVINGFLSKTGVASLLAFCHLPNQVPAQIAYSQLGMLIALIFIGLPFIVRTLEPALEDLDHEVEEAAESLGATAFQSFWRVIVPALVPAILTGFALSFARAVGEYGSVIFISNNKPGESQITAHLIMKKLENNDYAGATTLGAIMLVISLLMLIAINTLQWWATRRSKAV